MILTRIKELGRFTLENSYLICGWILIASSYFVTVNGTKIDSILGWIFIVLHYVQKYYTNLAHRPRRFAMGKNSLGMSAFDVDRVEFMVSVKLQDGSHGTNVEFYSGKGLTLSGSPPEVMSLLGFDKDVVTKAFDPAPVVSIAKKEDQDDSDKN